MPRQEITLPPPVSPATVPVQRQVFRCTTGVSSIRYTAPSAASVLQSVSPSAMQRTFTRADRLSFLGPVTRQVTFSPSQVMCISSTPMPAPSGMGIFADHAENSGTDERPPSPPRYTTVYRTHPDTSRVPSSRKALSLVTLHWTPATRRTSGW